MGISDLRNPVDSIKIKSEPSEPRTTLISWVLSVHSIQSEIPNPKSQIERRITPNLIEFYHYPFQHPKILILDNHLISVRFLLAVRKILTTKSEKTQLTSFVVPNKLSCYKKWMAHSLSGLNRYLKRRSFRIAAIHIATFSAIIVIFREACFVENLCSKSLPCVDIISFNFLIQNTVAFKRKSSDH